MHAVCGYSVKSTWLAAVEAGNYVGWPLLTTRNVKKYYPETTETPKGHLNQSRKNVRSTKSTVKPFETSNKAKLKGKKERDVYTKVYDVRETIYSDQTGQFPTPSLSGNKYIMVMVDIDSSNIIVEPMKSRKDAEMIRAYQALILRLKRANIIPKKHVLDNEISEAMKELIRDQYQLKFVPPGCHRRNVAEVAIRNFKAHFLSILAGVADDFPKNLWDRLLPQVEITVNLLRQSNATPTFSAYAHMCGPFDYNKMPLAPIGCNVQVHVKTDKRGTWAFHSVDGWYLSTSPEHYRTHKCHVKDTKSDRISDTVQFQHKNITNPTVTPHDKLMKALADCATLIKGITNIDAAHDIIRKLNRIASKIDNAPHLDHNSLPPMQPCPSLPPVQRVFNNTEPTRRITRSMAHDLPTVTVPAPRVVPTTAQIPIRPRPIMKTQTTHNLCSRTSPRAGNCTSTQHTVTDPRCNTTPRTTVHWHPRRVGAQIAHSSAYQTPTHATN